MTGGPCRRARRGAGRAPGRPAASRASSMISSREDVVDPVEDRRDRAEVRRQRRPGRRARSCARRYMRDVGPAEPVDRLLRVADDEQRTRRGTSTSRPVVLRRPRRRRRCARRSRSGSGRCPGTRRAAAAGSGRAGAARTSAFVAQQVAGEHEQVVELEPPVAPAAPAAVEHPHAAPVDDRAQRRLGDRADDAGRPADLPAACSSSRRSSSRPPQFGLAP